MVGLDNYPVLNPLQGGDYFGGESVQQSLLAKAFLSLGMEVSMIVKDHGQAQGECIGGIKVWKTFNEQDGLPGVRFLHPRLTSIWSALKAADADIYYQSCAGMITGVVAHYCARYHRNFVFRLAHDTDCIPGQQLINMWRDRKIYEYGLRRADLIAAQGVNQVELLRRNYRLDSKPINMAVELPDVIKDVDKDIDILWVNNLRPFKRPGLFVELAEKLSSYQFVMIGGTVSGYEPLYKEIEDRAARVSNLKFLGAVPYHRVNEYFERAKLFVNTSEREGFPNSFLQAWVRKVPVISFFDPDGLIAGRKMGAIPKDIEGMSRCVLQLMDSPTEREAAAERGRTYVIDNYAPASVARKYLELIASSGQCGD